MDDSRGLGDKKVNRVNLSLSNECVQKLKWLATACNMRPTELAGHLVESFLDDPEKVHELQERHCIHESYRVRLFGVLGHVKYEIGDRYDR